jgi:hypothetical protein
MDVLVHHIPGQNIISLARNKAEADNVKEYNGITILYLMGLLCTTRHEHAHNELLHWVL